MTTSLHQIFFNRLLAAAVAGFLLLAIWSRWRLSTYRTLHFVVCGAAAYLAYQAFNPKRQNWTWMLVAVSVLFNPFFPVRLPRSTWQYCDAVSASILLVWAFKMAESTKNTETRVLVIGTRHEFQRHQDKMPEREQVRAEFDQRLRQIITERKIDLIAEEAGDDGATWEKLKQDDELAAAFGGLFGEVTTVDSPVPTIARALADEIGTKHSDIDVDVRAEEGDLASIEKRNEAMTEKILGALGAATSVLVIVGEAHGTGVSERLKKAGMSVVSFRFP